MAAPNCCGTFILRNVAGLSCTIAALVRITESVRIVRGLGAMAAYDQIRSGGDDGSLEIESSIFDAFLVALDRGQVGSVEDFITGQNLPISRLLRLRLEGIWKLHTDSRRNRDSVTGAALMIRDAIRRCFDDPAEVAAPGDRSDANGDPNAPSLAEARGELNRQRYVDAREVGRGGMAVVWRVWDKELNRSIAMKRLPNPLAESLRPGRGGSPRSRVIRFLEEAQVTAQLDHPGIVPLHELAIDQEQRPYFTMRLVRGRNLEEIYALARAGRESWNLARVVGVLVQACQTVAFAHSRGVVHRDLKPANVMVGDFGETYVMDWGLAKVRDRRDLHDIRPSSSIDEAIPTRGLRRDSSLLTMDGTVIGTPAYMSPEQADGRLEEIDERSDVYSLGAMLYTLLASRAPFVRPGERNAARAILARVSTGSPDPIATLNPEAPAELVAICDKAMARDASRRYPNSKALAEDLQAYLDNRVVRAYETGAGAELRKWIRRNRLAASAGALAIGLLVCGFVAALIAYDVLEEESDAVLRLADARRLQDYVAEAHTLWPCVPERIAAMRSWLGRVAQLTDRLEIHEETLAHLRESGVLESDGRWSFPTTELQWQHDALEELVNGIEEINAPGEWTSGGAEIVAPRGEIIRVLGVEQRLEIATSVYERSIAAHWATWQQAIRSIADPEECPRYGGLKIAPQLGLIPIGRDPDSGLWEFAHLQTGELPELGTDGNLILSEATALVLVLIPGGQFLYGAYFPSAEHPEGSPNVDPMVDREGESSFYFEPHTLDVEPFFLSKFEMTQGQWLRCGGANPSSYKPDNTGSEAATLLHPVETISWEMAERRTKRLGLALPTEPQWEYAVRAGTDARWWTGNQPESVAGAANLAGTDDGYDYTSPVGKFLPNAFGLHDVIGNVDEWCADPPNRWVRTTRGGSWKKPAAESSSAHQLHLVAGFKNFTNGVRPARPLETSATASPRPDSGD